MWARLDKQQDLIVSPGPDARDSKFLSGLQDMGVRTVFLDPDAASGTTLQTMHQTEDSSYRLAGPGVAPQTGRRYHILSNTDIQRMLEEAADGLDFVIVDVDDWKIIPLENTIAKLHDIDTRILATATTAAEARKLFSILDIGVDGVILETSSMEEVAKVTALLDARSFEMVAAKVTAIREVGDGERVCVDTASMLNLGEGMLVGNRSNFMFLVHNESVGSSFTSPRPFRVNAGAVHCYTISPDGTTKYLSEMEGGSEVLVVDSSGRSRRATVGRSKIERRPMLFVGAATGSESGGIIAQNAETIRFVRPNGDLVSVTHLSEGDEVLVHATAAAGRHFGMKVDDEYILEK